MLHSQNVHVTNKRVLKFAFKGCLKMVIKGKRGYRNLHLLDVEIMLFKSEKDLQKDSQLKSNYFCSCIVFQNQSLYRKQATYT